MSLFQAELERLARLEPRSVTGTVRQLRGLTLLARDCPLPVGSLVAIEDRGCGAPGAASGAWSAAPRLGEIVGFDGDDAILMLFGEASGIAPGQQVRGLEVAPTIPVSPTLLGRVIDPLGNPMDGRGPVRDSQPVPLHAVPTAALRRRRISEPMPTGIRAIDGMLTLGRGQRIGIMAGPGVGKSTLLAMMARGTAADVTVIGLIGERGREVRDFIEDALGAEGLARAVLVVATGDESPLLRVRAAWAACAIAEFFSARGQDVMLLMDSVTRFAQAQRQIGLAVGEPPATKGYPPSVFALLPRLLERAGAVGTHGSITGIYTVLVEGDDLTEPVTDAARGVLDGHIVLSRRLAGRGHHPSIDIMESISRVADDVSQPAQIEARRLVRRLEAAYREAEELISIGAYVRGSSRDVDAALLLHDEIARFLQQDRREASAFPETCRRLNELALHGAKALAPGPARPAGVPT